MINIRKCICHDVSFDIALDVGKEYNVDTVDDLKQHISICDNCEMCRPYLDVCLKTGQTEFGEIL